MVIRVGDAIEWESKDSAPHTSTWMSGASNAEQWDSGTLSQGQTFRRTFTNVGSYSYLCTIHPFMTGTMTVTS